MIYTWSTKLQQTEAKHIVAEAKLNRDTQFYRIKGGGGVPPLPSPRVDEILGNCHPPSKIGQSQNYCASINSNGLLTL